MSKLRALLTGVCCHAGGKVAIYDLRRNTPLITKDHMYDEPIKDIKFHTAAGDHTGRQRVISADTHVIKVRSSATSTCSGYHQGQNVANNVALIRDHCCRAGTCAESSPGITVLVHRLVHHAQFVLLIPLNSTH